MSGTATVQNPDAIQCTLQFTLSLGGWKQIRKTLQSNGHHTELQIIGEIVDLVYQLEQVYYPTHISTPSNAAEVNKP